MRTNWTTEIRWDTLEQTLLSLLKQEVSNFMRTNSNNQIVSMAIETYFGSCLDEDIGVSIHFDTKRNLDQTISSYRKSAKNIEDLRWEVKHWKYQRINCQDSRINGQWEVSWFPIREKLCDAAKEYEDSLRAMEGKTSQIQSWLTNSACRTLFRMCDDGLFRDASVEKSLHRDFNYLVIGQGDTCFFDSWNRMSNVANDPW